MKAAGCGPVYELWRQAGGHQLLLRPKTAPELALDASLAKDFALTRLSHYVRVDEVTLRMASMSSIAGAMSTRPTTGYG